MSDDAKAQATAAKERGNELYKQKKFDEALKCYAQAVELNPQEMAFLTNRAAAFYEMKDYESCIKECQKAIEVGRENQAEYRIIAKAYTRMGNAFMRLKDFENAKLCFEKSLTEHRTPETRTMLSEVEKILKEKERREYINPELSLAEKEKGNNAFKKGDFPLALKHYNEAIKRNPDDAKLFSNRAACYMKLAEFPSALKDTEECVRLEPSFVKGHIRKGFALLAMKEFSRATTAFQKALELDPSNSEAVDGYRKCVTASNSNPDEVRRQALSDPEIQQILADPAMRLILEQMQTDPKAVQEHLRNPEVARKIEKLIEAGLIGMR